VLVRGLRRRPDVEVETILTHLRWRLARHGHPYLHTRRGKGIRLRRASPRCDLYRRVPTQVAHRRGGEWDALVDTQPACAHPGYCTGLSVAADISFRVKTHRRCPAFHTRFGNG
jgi:hypothetical protein